MPHRITFLAVVVAGIFSTESSFPQLGSWQVVEDPNEQLVFESERLIRRHGEELEFLPARYTADAVLVGWEETSRCGTVVAGDHLTLTMPDGKVHVLLKIAPIADIGPKLISIPTPTALTAEQNKSLTEELSKRVELDQAVRTGKSQLPANQVDSDNTTWLKEQIGKFGWLDAKRFGKSDASHAFLIVQHSGDLPLMISVLPLIEADVKAGAADPQDFALLYDRCCIYQAKPQRYGSQIQNDGKGTVCVLPVEDQKLIEKFRKDIGLFPLKAYLGVFIQMGKAKKYRFLSGPHDDLLKTAGKSDPPKQKKKPASP